jgi:hypothetical protein
VVIYLIIFIWVDISGSVLGTCRLLLDGCVQEVLSKGLTLGFKKLFVLWMTLVLNT